MNVSDGHTRDIHPITANGSFVNIWDIEVVRLISIKIDILSNRDWATTSDVNYLVRSIRDNYDGRLGVVSLLMFELTSDIIESVAF